MPITLKSSKQVFDGVAVKLGLTQGYEHQVPYDDSVFITGATTNLRFKGLDDVFELGVDYALRYPKQRRNFALTMIISDLVGLGEFD